MKDTPDHNRCSTPCQVVQVPHTSDTEIVQLTHCMQPVFSSSYITAHLGNKSCFYGNRRFIIGSMKNTLSLLSQLTPPYTRIHLNVILPPMCLSPKRLWRSHWNYACINLIISMHSARPAPFKLVQRHNFTRQHPCSPEFGVRHIPHAYGMDDAR